MYEEFLGRRLRAERERRRITLESIAANTKISVSLLKGLERDDVSRWPGGIFRRSFVRAYAQAIGLDPDDTVREFLERHPDSEEQAAPRTDAAAPPSVVAPRPAPTSHDVGLRLALADSPQPFSAGDLLRGMKPRLSAVAWDAGTTFAFAMTAYVFFQNFWAPLGVFMLFYYLCSVLILGNTPGVCLFAPVDAHQDIETDGTPEHDEVADLPTNALGQRAG